MIKLFRRLRKSLLMENHTGKYLKYAIGEIILVVIGILIALQINNWNEARKNKTIEQNYYCQFLEDFQLDKERILAIMKMNNLDREEGQRLIRDLNSMEMDKTDLLKSYLNVLRSEGFVASQTAYKDITSSGDIRLLKNKRLKKELIKYYADLELLTDLISSNRNKISDRLGNLDPYESGWFKVLPDEVFEPSVKAFLPDNDWHLDKNSEYFIQIQKNLYASVGSYSRNNDLFQEILNRMEAVYKALEKACPNSNSY